MSETSNASVLEMLASRICHDLISPVGAIHNGLEFMEEMGPDASEEAMNLISYSASQASAKLQAFRIAYGAGGKDPNIKPEDIQKAFSALVSAEGKIIQTWDPYGRLGPDPLPSSFCKILMCTMMLAMECLPKGGTLSVRPGENSDTLVIAEGPDAMVRDQIDESLKQTISVDNLDPRLVHPYAVSVIAGNYNYVVSITQIEDGKITFSMKHTDDSES